MLADVSLASSHCSATQTVTFSCMCLLLILTYMHCEKILVAIYKHPYYQMASNRLLRYLETGEKEV